MKLRFLCLLLASLLPCAVLAQTSESPQDEIVPRYDVEVIIFKNLKVPKSREFILPASSPGKTGNMFDLSSSASVGAAGKLGYEVLKTDEFRLLDVVTRLVESPRYQLLLHVAWRQPGLEREQVIPVWLKGGRIYGKEYTSIDNRIEMFDSRARETINEETGERSFEFDEQSLEAQELQLLEMQKAFEHQGLYELEGKISVVLSRYLHVYTDLVLRRPRLSADAVLDNPAEEAYLAARAADTRILNNHHLKEHRRMRSKNLHYLDNPEFGMLVLITPYEVAEGFEEAPIEAEADIEPVTSE